MATLTSVSTATPTVTPTATTTPLPSGLACGDVGSQCHADLSLTGNTGTGLILYAVGPDEPGPCDDLVNCVQFTITGSFTILGEITGLNPGVVPILAVPVVNRAGQLLGFRETQCAAAGVDGISVCSAVVAEPNVFPQLAVGPGLGRVEVRLFRLTGAPGLIPGAPLPSGPPGAGGAGAAQPVVAVVPLLPPVPPLPAVVLPPGPPAVLPPFAPAALPSTRPEVPVIPEADALGLLLGGLVVLVGWAVLGRRARGR